MRFEGKNKKSVKIRLLFGEVFKNFQRFQKKMTQLLVLPGHHLSHRKTHVISTVMKTLDKNYRKIDEGCKQTFNPI